SEARPPILPRTSIPEEYISVWLLDTRSVPSRYPYPQTQEGIFSVPLRSARSRETGGNRQDGRGLIPRSVRTKEGDECRAPASSGAASSDPIHGRPSARLPGGG